VRLTQARETLAAVCADALSDDVGVIDHVPDAVAPPMVLIGWGDPMVKPETLCAWTGSMDVMCVAQRLEPGGQYGTLEEMISLLAPAIKAAPGFTLIDVTSPFPMQIGGVDYLVASLNITHDVEE